MKTLPLKLRIIFFFKVTVTYLYVSVNVTLIIKLQLTMNKLCIFLFVLVTCTSCIFSHPLHREFLADTKSSRISPCAALPPFFFICLAFMISGKPAVFLKGLRFLGTFTRKLTAASLFVKFCFNPNNGICRTYQAERIVWQPALERWVAVQRHLAH